MKEYPKPYKMKRMFGELYVDKLLSKEVKAVVSLLIKFPGSCVTVDIDCYYIAISGYPWIRIKDEFVSDVLGWLDKDETCVEDKYLLSEETKRHILIYEEGI